MTSQASEPDAGPRARAIPRAGVIHVLQILILTIVIAVPTIGCLRAACVIDPDIWWHLAIGDWIFLHRAVPHTGLFTRSLGGAPWQAYSWLFDLLVARLFHYFGLVGIVAYTTAMVLAITVALFSLLRHLHPNFNLAALLTFAAGIAIVHIETPRPWLFSILFFIFELHILMRARNSGRLRELTWLPLLFAFWANIHIEFVIGLIALALALAESILIRWLPNPTVRTRSLPLACALAASLLAVFVNPYGLTLYSTAYNLSTLGGSLSKIDELQSIPFRDLSDFTVLLLTLAAAATLARQRRVPIFETVLLLFAAIVSFHSLRDVWVIAVVAPVTVAAGNLTSRAATQPISSFVTPLAALLSLAACLLAAPLFNVDNPHLADLRAQALPSAAAAFVRQQHLSGPLYNDFSWGGYLLWDLNLPDSIDGRSTLYGSQQLDRSLISWTGQPDWATDPQLQSAHLVIGPISAPLTQLLRNNPHFALIYEDRLAAVFVPRQSP